MLAEKYDYSLHPESARFKNISVMKRPSIYDRDTNQTKYDRNIVYLDDEDVILDDTIISESCGNIAPNVPDIKEIERNTSVNPKSRSKAGKGGRRFSYGNRLK